MEIKWVEDFLSVVETLNFSRSAKLRNVTQPAFGRRIRSLETWLGAELFDRSSYPCTLTPAGESFVPIAREMLNQSMQARLVLRGQLAGAQTAVRFAMPHTLLLTVFPKLLSEIEKKVGAIATTVMAGNVHDAVMALVERNCDLLICYDHRQQGIALDTERYDVLSLGKEPLRPYVKTLPNGKPKYVLPGTPNDPLPFLSYSPYSSLSRIVEKALHTSPRRVHLFRRFETDLAEGLKNMAVEGHGIAWLPASAVAREVAEGKLALAIAPNDSEALEQGLWCDEMDIRVYRRLDGANPEIDRIWNYLKAEHAGG
ncbi:MULTISPECIES: LysR family transcriptional regulator [unclassified Herbaspirillum]|uniref:LysR family transcriptional regulator n=1 Tax=unclassified Herbaspirillum TaxID=2624150 RepID=UPI001152A36E|nr:MULTISPECIES: LysR substrate-binding domain-containing protein [unclassified Herbaspirillum]MBB5389993.1 DNA-binding transcriptional LysR family regulator [Herbaspirillum sp. SJZ102]TQK09501.1 DNA-binding transcriptional LysR family regulator [Herbaspirillum sp. SJZ130]TQK13812.1 DNA-binding transcriptional LysR family regulator [Herbaspirillum sp. SJZ106]